MPRRTEGRQPNAKEMTGFIKACREFTDPNDDEQFSAFARAAQAMTDHGWKPENVISKLWHFQPQYRNPNMTANEAASLMIAEQEEIRARQQAEIEAQRYPFGRYPLFGELAFHASIIQEAALSGRTIVVRSRQPSLANLPPDVPSVSPRRSYYLNPAEIFNAFARGNNR